MDVENKVPILLQFMFGEAAALARQTAAARLLRWCRAMDDWLAERQRKNNETTYRASIYAWKQLLSQCTETPWEITPTDVKEFIEVLQEQGYTPSTIANRLSVLSAFYAR